MLKDRLNNASKIFIDLVNKNKLLLRVLDNVAGKKKGFFSR